MQGLRVTQRGRTRGARGRVQTYRVTLTREEADELRALIRDEDGDADEDLLDCVYDALKGIKHEGERDVVVKLTKRQREAVFRALDDTLRNDDETYLDEALIELDLAVAKHSRKHH